MYSLHPETARQNQTNTYLGGIKRSKRPTVPQKYNWFIFEIIPLRVMPQLNSISNFQIDLSINILRFNLNF